MKKILTALCPLVLIFSCLTIGPEMLYYESDEPIEVYLVNWDGSFSEKPALSFEDFSYFVEDDTYISNAVVLIFNNEDAEAFGEFTGSHIGENAAFYYFGDILIVATIHDAIDGGQLLITFPSSDDRDIFLAKLKINNEAP